MQNSVAVLSDNHVQLPPTVKRPHRRTALRVRLMPRRSGTNGRSLNSRSFTGKMNEGVQAGFSAWKSPGCFLVGVVPLRLGRRPSRRWIGSLVTSCPGRSVSWGMSWTGPVCG
jgi:hypothetical protein